MFYLQRTPFWSRVSDVDDSVVILGELSPRTTTNAERDKGAFIMAVVSSIFTTRISPLVSDSCDDFPTPEKF